MHAFLFSRAGILRRRHDYQLRRYNGVRRDPLPAVAVISRLHDSLDECEDSALDGFRDRLVFITRAACV